MFTLEEYNKIFLSTPSARRATKAEQSGCIVLTIFLSTPSARRATGHDQHRRYYPGYFYPRPPRGGRLMMMTVRGCSE